MSKKPVLDQTAFDLMLLWLNPDREKAAQKYEAIRTRLIEIFAGRRLSNAELLADNTIDRVITKVPKLMEGWVGDPIYYFLAVAKKIILETLKPPPLAFVPPEQDSDELERADRCLERCMSSLLSEDERRLILKYVNGNIRQRQEQARELGITPNALRIRVCQIKKILRPCVEDCLQGEAT